jgi:hypothetical protein
MRYSLLVNGAILCGMAGCGRLQGPQGPTGPQGVPGPLIPEHTVQEVTLWVQDTAAGPYRVDSVFNSLEMDAYSWLDRDSTYREFQDVIGMDFIMVYSIGNPSDVVIYASAGDSLFKSDDSGSLKSATTRPAPETCAPEYHINAGAIYFMRGGESGKWIKMKVHSIKFDTLAMYPGWKRARIITEIYFYRQADPDFSVN